MLFRKRIHQSCQYCGNATQLNDEEVLCIKRGIVTIEKRCRKFIYDPCKRIPRKLKASNFARYDAEDFSL